jgi:hypothetical protein
LHFLSSAAEVEAGAEARQVEAWIDQRDVELQQLAQVRVYLSQLVHGDLHYVSHIDEQDGLLIDTSHHVKAD